MTHGLPPELAEKEPLLRRYLDELLEANKKFNLTAVRSSEEAWSRHIVESASLVPLLGHPKSLIDVGTGGGLPGMVLAICLPEVQVTLLEATEKKTRFLRETAETLCLPNVEIVCDRAESAAGVGSPLRESFEMVTARAVAPLRTLLELTLPFAKVGGCLVAIKGDKAKEEVAEAQRALKLLSGRLVENVSHPSGHVLRIEKTAPSNARYPRRNGEPKHRPL